VSSGDPFIAIAKQRVPLSTNPGAARYWTQSDMVPRPDRQLSTLKAYSWLGFLGIDHFYLRSPMTGLAKLLTLGGVGLWYLWDLLQVYTESERVINYGLSTPFDYQTGIAQGMITDLANNNYKANSTYSTWLLSMLFSFAGADSFQQMNTSKGFLKLMLFVLFIFLVSVGIDLYRSTGIGIMLLGTVLLAFLLALAVFVPWMNTVRQIIATPSVVLEKGIKYSDKEKAQANTFVKMPLEKVDIDAATRQQTLADLQTKDIPGSKIREMFRIKHISETDSADADTGSSDGESGSMNSFFVWLFAFPRMIWDFIRTTSGDIAKGAAGIIDPPGVAVSKVIEVELAENPTIAAGIGKQMIGKTLGIPHAGEELLSGAAKAGATIAELPAKAGATIAQLPAKAGATIAQLPATSTRLMKGGARDELSTDALVLGATVAALIVGGAVKGAVDYLMPE
jgi:TM2 domain-containing membrane protein YozV